MDDVTGGKTVPVDANFARLLSSKVFGRHYLISVGDVAKLESFCFWVLSGLLGFIKMVLLHLALFCTIS